MTDFLNIKTKGYNETILRNNNNNNKVSKLNWDANYNGENGNVSLDYSENGKPHEHVKISFDNDDLANLLNVPSINMPIHQRLKNDFMKIKRRGTRKNNNRMIIELMKQSPTENSFIEPSNEYNINRDIVPFDMSKEQLIPLMNTSRKRRGKKSKKNYMIKHIKSPRTNKSKRNYKYLVSI